MTAFLPMSGDRPRVDPVIRPVRVDDARAVYAIRRQPAVMRFTTAMPEDTLERTARFLSGFGPDDRVVVAEANGRVIGMAGLHRGRGKQRHAAELGIMVHDDWHGRGVGTALLAHLLAVADGEWRLGRVSLEVMADNPGAIRLYERFGFEIEGRKREAVRRREDAGPVDMLTMGRLRPTSDP